MTNTSYKSAVKAVLDRGFGIRADLSRIKGLAELLDHPELSFPTIHVAGTNGKTTTTRMIAAILAAHGLTAGSYTSPHLQSIRERFTLWGVGDQGFVSDLISENDFAELVSYLTPFVHLIENERNEQVTYFEMTTAMAFEWMSQVPVSVGVMETGMGGTWDATNVVEPKFGVITRIDVDHHKFLGRTAEENANEKAGIIKANMNVVIAEQEPSVLAILKEKAKDVGAQVFLVGQQFQVIKDELALGGRFVTIRGIHDDYENIFIPVYGAHQARNLVCAVAACELFLDASLSSESLTAGLARFETPGRLEIVRRDPLVILDGAHNVDGAKNLGPALQESFGAMRRTFVISITQEKDFEAMIQFMAPYADRIIFTSHDSYPSESPDVLAASKWVGDKEVFVIPKLEAAVDEAISISLDDEMVVVTGSLYGVGQARTHLLGTIT